MEESSEYMLKQKNKSIFVIMREREIVKEMLQLQKEKSIKNEAKQKEYSELIKQTIKKSQYECELDRKAMQERMEFKNEYRKALESQINNKKLNLSIESERHKCSQDSSIAMVPGLYNIASVGTKPICRIGANYRSITKPHMINQDSTHTSMDVERKYNPITNPFSVFTSNPYILKEIKKYHTNNH